MPDRKRDPTRMQQDKLRKRLRLLPLAWHPAPQQRAVNLGARRVDLTSRQAAPADRGSRGEAPEEAESRVRVEIPLMTGHPFSAALPHEEIQFGKPLTQLQQLINRVTIPTNAMQGDAALADVIMRMGILPRRLGFP